MTDKEKFRKEVEKLKSNLLYGACSSQIAMETMCKEEAYNEVLAILDTMQKEPVSEELENASRNYADNEEYGDDVYFAIEAAFEAGSKWQKENLWKPADGEDLPEIDREVIAILDNGKVGFAHRPDPKGWDAKSIITEKVEHYTPETYDKGGWNISNVKWWLDCSLPNMEED